MKLSNIRSEIDKIDKKIIKLFARRFEFNQLARVKKQASGMDIIDKTREAEVLQNVIKLAKNDLISEEFVKKLYQMIINESVRLQNKKNA